MRILFFLLLISTLTGCGFDQGIQRDYIISESHVEDVTSEAVNEDL